MYNLEHLYRNTQQSFPVTKGETRFSVSGIQRYECARDGKATLENGGKEIKEIKELESMKEREEGRRREMIMGRMKR
jgi:hypothetical protein